MIETTNQMIYLDAPGLAAKHVPLVALNPGIFQQHRRARALDGTLFEALQQETLQLLQRSHVGIRWKFVPQYNWGYIYTYVYNTHTYT